MSLVEKPEPETSTVVPAAADEVLSVMVGDVPPVTVRVWDAESSPGLPIAVIVYVPAPTAATVKLPVSVPLDTEQV